MKIIWPNTQETATATTITITGCYYNDKWNLHNDLIKAPKNNNENNNSNKAIRSCEKLRRRFRARASLQLPDIVLMYMPYVWHKGGLLSK